MRISKYRALALFLGVMTLFGLLAGCQAAQPSSTPSAAGPASPADNSPAQPADSPAQQVTITFWNTYGDTEAQYFTDNILPLFYAEHPEITVNCVQQDSGQYNQMIATAFGTGQVPDVARVDIVNTAAYAAQGGIIALDGLPGFDALKASVLAGPLSTNLYKGSYYGLPLDTNCKAAVVNMNVMQALGLSAPPATMEDFIAAVQAKGDGQYRLSVSGVGDWDMYPYFWLFGGTLTDPGFTKAGGYLDSPASVAAIQEIQKLHDAKVLTIRDVDGTADAWDGIKTDYAMFFEGPWYFSSNTDAADNGIIPAVIPSYNGQTASVVGGENVVIFSGSKHQDAAWTFAQFLLSEQAQLGMLDVGQLPVLADAANSDKVKNDPVWSVYMRQMATAQARVPSPQNTVIQQIWSDAMTAIFTAGADVQATLTAAAQQMDAQLSQ